MKHKFPVQEEYIRNKEIRIYRKFYLLPIQQEQLQHIDDAIIKKTAVNNSIFQNRKERKESIEFDRCRGVCEGETREKGTAFRRYHQ